MNSSKTYGKYFREWYSIHDSFVMRNPLFPAEVFFNWKTETSTDSSNSKSELRNQLREFYLKPIAQEALYIGSPDLHEQLMLWLENKIEKQDKKEKIELSLVKYMIRMCTRCTPYGLFASCSVGKISNRTQIHLKEKNLLQRSGRLDMDYMGELLSFLLKKKEIVEQLLFYPNTSLYTHGEQWRYIEHRFQKETGRSYHLVQIEQSAYLNKIIETAKKGCTPIVLAEAVTEDDISSAEANEFISELISEQILVSELELNITGEEYFFVLLRKLKSLMHTEKIVKQLENVKTEFENIKATNHELKNKFYTNIIRHLQQLEVAVHLKTLIQVDSFRPASSCTLSKKLVDEILCGAGLLQAVTTDSSINDQFADFKNAFIQRYGNQWISLVEVLDTESGIGYGKFSTTGMEESPLIDKLPIGNIQAALQSKNVSDTETFKWQLYHEAISENKTEVIIDDKIIELLAKKEFLPEGLPDSMHMMLKINAYSTADIDDGNYTIILQPPAGPSGGNLLGRFCNLNEEIENFTRKILQDEETHNPGCVFAEIVHLPESRIGNVLMRPQLRSYEIPYLCGSILNSEFQIPVTDLLVGIEENKIVIRSKRLNKIVIPRMTNAHNFSLTTLPVYQFLCDLQYQEIRNIGWQWGALESCSFLPRVSYDKFILSKARWVIVKDDVKEIIQKNDAELISAFSLFAKNKNLPHYVLLSQGDNELLLNIQNIFCIKLLLNEVNKSVKVILTETLDTPEQCWIKSDDGSYAGEFIFVFNKKITDVQNVKEKFSVPKENKNINRYFPVSSQWLYAKIYCGTKTAEQLLSNPLKKFTEELLIEKIIDKFFFLRYSDPLHHIRIRFYNEKTKDFWKEVIERLQLLLNPFMNDHLVHNLQFETYQREAERYGYDTINESEEIFFHHSVATLKFMAMLYGDEGEQYRWQVTMKAIDLILDNFNYELQQKRDFIKMLHQNFSHEFKIHSAQQKKITERFNNNKHIIQKLINEDLEEKGNLKRAIEIFRIDNRNYHKVIKEIISAPSINCDSAKLNLLMASYLHMFVNRIMVSNQRKAELVIYDYLLKFYDSKIAREKINKTSIRKEVLIA